MGKKKIVRKRRGRRKIGDEKVIQENIREKGNEEGVKKGKSELYRYLAAHNGVAFINQDEPFLEELASAVRWKILFKKGEYKEALQQLRQAANQADKKKKTDSVESSTSSNRGSTGPSRCGS